MNCHLSQWSWLMASMVSLACGARDDIGVTNTNSTDADSGMGSNNTGGSAVSGTSSGVGGGWCTGGACVSGGVIGDRGCSF